MANENLPMPEGLTAYKKIDTNLQEDKTVKQALSVLQDMTKSIASNYYKSDANTQKQINALTLELSKQRKSFEEVQQEIALDIKDLKDNGASNDDIVAYLKKYDSMHRDNITAMTGALDRVKDGLEKFVENDKIPPEQRHLMRKQLLALEQMYDLENKEFKKRQKLSEEMNEELKALHKSWESADKKEKKERNYSIKNTLLTTALGQLRLLVDPISKMMNSGRGFYQQLEHISSRKQEEADIYEKYDEKFNEFQKERSQDNRLTELLGTSSSQFAGMQTDDQENKDKVDDIPHKPIQPLLALPAPEGMDKPSPDEQDKIKTFASGNESAIKALAYDGGNGDVSFFTEKVHPDESDLLQKGGLIGAGFVYLANELGGLDKENKKGKGKDKQKDKDDGGGSPVEKALDFVKKNGKAIGGFAAVAGLAIASTAMIAGSAEMQKRDSEDAKEHFKKGNVGRGYETSLLGYRSRITKETANKELGRTTGKAALATGGVATGVGAAAGGAAIASTLVAGGGRYCGIRGSWCCISACPYRSCCGYRWHGGGKGYAGGI